MSEKNLYELGETPPLGHVPSQMYASVIRPERYGEPRDAFEIEVMDVPKPGPKEILVWVMAVGINYNNVWASLAHPVDVIQARKRWGYTEDFHIGGSDGSGIVWAIGDEVTTHKVGDEVVLSAGMWDETAPDVVSGRDPMLSSTNRAWGYEISYGSFAQFCLVDHYQCHPRPQNLSWADSASFMASGATAYRMLFGWPPNIVREGDPVLVWGGSGGLGTMAIQLVADAGGLPIAVVSHEDHVDYCMELGAKGVINRTDPAFNHWGRMPDLDDDEATRAWLKGARAFGAAFWEKLGEKRNPMIVFEHPGEATMPTSLFMVDNGGMVVGCAGSTGYNADFDLRYLWMRQKRIQGSHISNTEDNRNFTRLVSEGRVKPTTSKVYEFDELGEAHQQMRDNVHPPGNMGALVNAKSATESESPL